MRASLAALLVTLAAAAPPALAGAKDKIADHDLLAKEGGAVSAPGPVTFAVLGNTRAAVPALDRVGGGVYHGDAVLQSIVSDVAADVGDSGPSFAVLLGDVVRAGTEKSGKGFDASFAPLLLGATAPEGDPPRLRTVPVAGDREAEGDPRYETFGSAFPGVGEDIGHNRVGTWYHFDVTAAGTRWRFVVLDSGKERLGSRWTEQLAWIQEASKGDFDYALVFMHEPSSTSPGRSWT